MIAPELLDTNAEYKPSNERRPGKDIRTLKWCFSPRVVPLLARGQRFS
jgi:hypothetical protein